MTTRSGLWAAMALVAGGAWAEDLVGPVVEARTEVRNGAAGHDAAEATFPTTIDGEGARHLLGIENGCGLVGPRCSHLPVAALTITLNDATVFHGVGPREGEQLEVALNPRGGQPNHLVVRSGGEPGSRARVVIAAVERPPQPLGGRAVLSSGDASSALAVHIACVVSLG